MPSPARHLPETPKPSDLWAQAEREHDEDATINMNRRYRELMVEYGYYLPARSFHG